MVTRVRVRRLALRSPDRPSVRPRRRRSPRLVSSRLVSSRLTWDVDITFVGFRDVFPVGRVRQVRSPPWLRITLAWPRFRDLLLLEFDPPLRHPCRRRPLHGSSGRARLGSILLVPLLLGHICRSSRNGKKKKKNGNLDSRTTRDQASELESVFPNPFFFCDHRNTECASAATAPGSTRNRRSARSMAGWRT